VALSAYRTQAIDYADVLLPIAPFTETAGTFVSTEGRVQSFNGVVKPLGEARPAWKILRVLGTMLGVAGFELDSIDDVRADIAADLDAFVAGKLNNAIGAVATASGSPPSGIERIGEVPIYSSDAIVRRAASLQKTADARMAGMISLPGALFEKFALAQGGDVRVTQGERVAVLKARRDDGLPDNCVRVAAGHVLTSALGAPFGEVMLERVAVERAAE
jgi:NADH-quinone oxidoreductase subunit G